MGGRGSGRRRGSRGVVLLIVLAVLLVLSLIATLFVTLSSVEQTVARSFIDESRARLVAEAGIDHAVRGLQEVVSRGFFPAGQADQTWAYYGSVADERNSSDPTTPLESARNPSFAYEDEDPQNPYDAQNRPKEVTIDGVSVGLSGTMLSGTYGARSNLFTLRITDTSGMIHVNDGARWGPNHSVSRNLCRILNVLGAQRAVQIPALGDKILAARPRGGFRSKHELLVALDGDEAAFQRVRDFVTVHAWTDTTVANPVPLSASVASPLAGTYLVDHARPMGGVGGRIYRYGPQKNYVGSLGTGQLSFSGPGSEVFGYDSLHPQWIEVVARAPVNVNSAPREVLVSLLADLQGFFLVERRRDSPPSPGAGSFVGGGYGWSSQKLTYDPGLSTGSGGGDGDEIGVIHLTTPITVPGGRKTGGIDAGLVADEILACRERRTSPGVAGTDYAALPFGGPFRTWAQFELFVDHLVRGGLLRDLRPAGTFYDILPNGTRVASEVQQRIAAQAIGDVIKANFNPNLHLNELNPDRLLYRHVDKTDLVVNSTEFCFTPMGYFEIECLGRVVRPDGGGDALTVPSRTMSECRVLAGIKLFDVVRQTTQRQFYDGSWGERASAPETNNNWSLETGPEPDNGPQPSENGWSGYVALPTLGGNFAVPGQHKPKKELWTTYPQPGLFPGTRSLPRGGSQFGSTIHSHFQLDSIAHHHRDTIDLPGSWPAFALPLGGWWLVYGTRASVSMNWEDRTEPILSPYSPADSGWVPAPPPYTHRYRLGRNFTLPTTSSLPARGFEYAPSDLRIDGIYAERHSAIGYFMNQGTSWNFHAGTVAFWMKPGFFPESTGKPRALLSMSRYHRAGGTFLNFSPFTLYYFPSHESASGRVSLAEEPRLPMYVGGIGKFRPASLAFGIGLHPSTGYHWEMLSPNRQNISLHANVLTPSLNHEFHGREDDDRFRGADGKWNHLRGHEWMHVVVDWSFPQGVRHQARSVRIYINGQELPGTAGVPSYYYRNGAPEEMIGFTPVWYLHSIQVALGGFGPKWANNQIRLGGEISKPLALAFNPREASIFPRNYAADSTLDEFFLWTQQGGETLSNALSLWNRGRYYKPDDGKPEDALFQSAPIDLGTVGLARRKLPMAGPGGVGSPAPDYVPPPYRLRGISWTVYAEDYDRTGAAGTIRPKMYDYSTQPPGELRPEAIPDANGFSGETPADAWVEVDGQRWGPYRNEGYSAICDPRGNPLEVKDSTGIRYRVKLKTGPTTPGTVLLATPVLDDVTLYFDPGGAEFVDWYVIRTTRS